MCPALVDTKWVYMPVMPLGPLVMWRASPRTTFGPSVVGLGVTTGPVPTGAITTPAPPFSPTGDASTRTMPSKWKEALYSLAVDTLQDNVVGGAPDGPPVGTVGMVSGELNLSVLPSLTREGDTNDMGVTPTTDSSPTRPVIYAVLFSGVRLLHVVAQVAPVRVATTKVSTRAIVPALDPEWTFTTPGVATGVVPVVVSMAMDSNIALSTRVCNLGSFLFYVFSPFYQFFNVCARGCFPRGAGVVCGTWGVGGRYGLGGLTALLQ